MPLVLLGTAMAVIVGLSGTRPHTSLARRRGWVQFLRDDGPTSHHTKRGTPQMGGIAIIGSTLIAFVRDTGSLGLGGALAGPAIMTRNELLMVILGGICVAAGLGIFYGEWVLLSETA